MTSVLAGVRLDLAKAPKRLEACITPRPCRCNGARLVWAASPAHCFKCGRDTRVLSGVERADLYDREAYAVLAAAIARTRDELNAEVHERTGCDGFIGLLRETYWLADTLRNGWVPA